MAAYYPNFPPLTIMTALPLNMSDARKPLIFKAFRASLTLVPARYIAPRDAEGGGHLLLRQRDGAAEAVPQADDLSLPSRERLRHQPAQAHGAVPVVDIVQHGVVHAHHVHELERVALLVRVDGVGQRYLALQLLLTAEIHQDLIRYPLLTDS